MNNHLDTLSRSYQSLTSTYEYVEDYRRGEGDGKRTKIHLVFFNKRRISFKVLILSCEEYVRYCATRRAWKKIAQNVAQSVCVKDFYREK
jgi:hypothetical protein